MLHKNFVNQCDIRLINNYKMENCKSTSLTNTYVLHLKDIINIFQGDSGGPLLYQRMDGKYEVIGKNIINFFHIKFHQ